MLGGLDLALDIGKRQLEDVWNIVVDGFAISFSGNRCQCIFLASRHINHDNLLRYLIRSGKICVCYFVTKVSKNQYLDMERIFFRF